MKPKDLKSVFTFQERHPCLKDGVLYVPAYYSDHANFECPPFFANQNPICLEYCSGNGDWIAEKARLFPDKNWIAVEKRYDRVKKIWAKVKNGALNNLMIVSGEALTFTLHYLPDNYIDAIYINFPDPWPKGKHAKNRLMKPLFIDQLSRVLKLRKSVTLATDDFTYMTKTLALFCAHSLFKPSFDAPHYLLDYPDYGESWFGNLWKEKGRQIYYTSYIYAPD